MAMTFEYSPDWPTQFQWAIIAGFVTSFIVSFCMGANDSANAWGTSVGSGVLKLWHSYVLMSIFNTLGALLLGFKDTETIRHGIFEIDIYDKFIVHNATTDAYTEVRRDQCALNDTITSFAAMTDGNWNKTCTEYTSADYLLGELAALSGSSLWKLIAIGLKMPVSATHSIIGASVGFALTLSGPSGIKWAKIGSIALSWVLSPLLAGVISALIYTVIKVTVMMRKEPFEAALRMFPVFIWFTLAVNVFSILYQGSKFLHFDQIPGWGAFLIANGVGLAIAVFCHVVLGKWIRNRALHQADIEVGAEQQRREQEDRDKPAAASQNFELRFVTNSSKGRPDSVMPAAKSPSVISTMEKKSAGRLKCLIDPVEEDMRAQKVFNCLQIMSACFLSFSHGANDTANSVGPLVGMWLTYKTGSASAPAESRLDVQLILVFGAFSVVVGLWCLGHRVMRTIGKKITHVSAPSGFAIELGAGLAVLLASKVGIPVSSTYCAVGAVVCVGVTKSSVEGVSWRTFRNIFAAWMCTVPVSAGAAALFAYLLAHFTLGNI